MPTRKLIALFVPEGLVLLAAVLLVQWGVASPSAAPILRFFPIVVVVAGTVLAWRFQRGRLLLALLALVLADRAMLWLAPPDSDAPHAGPVIVRVLAMLLPITFAVLAFIGERAPLSTAGIRRLAMLAGATVAVLAIWLLAALDPAGATRAVSLVLLPAPVLAWLPVGQPAALVALVAILAMIARALHRPDAEARGFLWAAIGTLVATAAGPAEGHATLYLASAGLVLVFATVQSAYAMAYHDELTGLPARRALNDALQRVDGTYTVAMVDVDHFKKFNDTHGHDVGDQVLRMVAGRLDRVAGGGKAFRYGGEEFTVLFPGKTAEESAPHLESLREAVQGATFSLRASDRPKKKPATPRATAGGAKKLSVTVSIGVAQARGRAMPDAVVRAADKALYRAKEAGRNQVAL